jgi:hypothetical protein
MIMGQKPWEAIGMSRTSWYRRGKPDVWPPPMALPPLHKAFASDLHISKRTAFRALRILKADPDLFGAVRQGWCKWGQAEWIITRPDVHRCWREENGLPWPVPSRE